MEYLTVSEAAELKGCSVQYIKKVCKDGKLSCTIEINDRKRPKYMIRERNRQNAVKPGNERKRIYPAEALAGLADAARSLGVRVGGAARRRNTEREIEKTSRLADAEGISYGKYMALRRR